MDQTARDSVAHDRPAEARFVHREIVALVTLCVVVVIGLTLTRAAAAANRAQRLRDALEWYEAGTSAGAAGRTPEAVRALRRAVAIDRGNRHYQLALAAALAADAQDDVAHQVLLAARDSAPEDPEVNVQLARLAARRADLAEAVRYYQNAMYGVWSENQVDARRQLRIELIRYLLANGQRGRAVSELLVLSGNLSADAASLTEVARLYLDAGEPVRALDHFRRALQMTPADRAALAGAGEAAFEAGDYRDAQRYLRAAKPQEPRLSDLASTADLVLSRDPLRPGLPFAERRARLIQGIDRAKEALDACAARDGTEPADRNALASLRAEISSLEPALPLAKLRRSPDTVDTGVSVIYRAEQQTASACGQGSPFDRALLIIGQRHAADAQ